MHTYADRIKENKSQSVANEVSQKQSSGAFAFQFVDNRSEAVAQRKLQEMANNSPQSKQGSQWQAMVDNYFRQQQHTKQNGENSSEIKPTQFSMKTNSEADKEVVQLASDRKYGQLHNGCGTQADYFIDPQSPLVGKSPPKSRPPWWSDLKKAVPDFSEKYLVQGHLINHHVGGEDNMSNLTPITKSANGQMETFIESDVKKRYKEAEINQNEVMHFKAEACNYGGIKNITELGGSQSLQNKITPYLQNFCEWVGAEYDIYKRVYGDRRDIDKTKLKYRLPQMKWVKNENKDLKGTY